MREDNKRMVEKCRDMEGEMEKLRKDNSYLVSWSEGDISKLNNYLNECEFTISEQKLKINDLEDRLH